MLQGDQVSVPPRPTVTSLGSWSNVGGSVTPFAGEQPRIVTLPPTAPHPAWFIFLANMAGVSEMAAPQTRGLGSSVANITPPTQVVRPKSDIINVFAKTCQRWHLLPQHQIVLLGYKGGESLGQQLLDGSLLEVPQDVQERTGYILAISIGLGALFDESEKAEIAWLNTPRETLNGQSALAFMLEGRMANVMDVAAMVAHERGM
jgi:Protein of unknown function (DUF2384)